MTQIFLLGSFHFYQTDIKFTSEQTQLQLQKIVDKIAVFNPDTIAVELAVHQQDSIDQSYARFALSDLHNPSKMLNDDLGNITMFESIRPISYNNEAVQIAYRLGKMLEIKKIYGIDDDHALDMRVMENPTEQLRQKTDYLLGEMQEYSTKDGLELYRYYNSDGWSRMNHDIYLETNSINNGEYEGAMMVTKWYERNLKIFANLQKLAKHSERMFIIYGAGHLQTLRDFINAYSEFELVNIYDYL